MVIKIQLLFAIQLESQLHHRTSNDAHLLLELPVNYYSFKENIHIRNLSFKNYIRFGCFWHPLQSSPAFVLGVETDSRGQGALQRGSHLSKLRHQLSLESKHTSTDHHTWNWTLETRCFWRSVLADVPPCRLLHSVVLPGHSAQLTGQRSSLCCPAMYYAIG